MNSKISAAALAAMGLLVLSVSPASADAQCGKASWYALSSKTASGEPMRADKLTAAHKKLPFGTRLKVVNKRNGKAVVVRINDRGPFVKGRILDLSKAAARELGFIGAGHTEVCMQVLARP
ncbi:MAG: septal ring lytic transglycosylase RlpA family protein [Nitratireductor sp.]|nr:septal ring lytic transglycosylase RlpA family protein [Nitratireductor sp.]MCB1455430.1 septal ring lytic transglycosylase RlpA family protein [Nitratireductor sp.]MCB1458867.1 septal ring lytic transglycosylase RlpA family protein [Nitratireductor sp.]